MLKESSEFDLKTLEKKSEEGDLDAQYELSQRYYKGDGVPQDFEKAKAIFDKVIGPEMEIMRKNWKELAFQNDPQAQFALGNMYFEGLGVPQDRQKAFEFYEKSLAQNFAPAQCHLAHIYYYYEAEGIPQDLKKSRELFEKSAAQGFEPAKQALKELFPQ